MAESLVSASLVASGLVSRRLSPSGFLTPEDVGTLHYAYNGKIASTVTTPGGVITWAPQYGSGVASSPSSGASPSFADGFMDFTTVDSRINIPSPNNIRPEFTVGIRFKVPTLTNTHYLFGSDSTSVRFLRVFVNTSGELGILFRNGDIETARVSGVVAGTTYSCFARYGMGPDLSIMAKGLNGDAWDTTAVSLSTWTPVAAHIGYSQVGGVASGDGQPIIEKIAFWDDFLTDGECASLMQYMDS